MLGEYERTQDIISYIMADKKHAAKGGAQNTNNSSSNTATKPVQTKKQKSNNTDEVKEEENSEDIHGMFEIIMKKLSKLDSIESRMESLEQEFKDVKSSIEFVHAEVEDIKKVNEHLKKSDEETKKRIENLEQLNSTLNNRVIDLQARSMRDNLIFYNVKESDGENTTALIHDILENTLGIENAKTMKIDRSHRMGKKQGTTRTKQRAIVAKFNYFQDKERVLANVKKFKGSGMAVSEQFPDEIIKERKRLYPEFKKAKEQGKRVKLVRNRLYIDGQLYRG